jgi:ubiquinone/menaquinone biosynthesis C-methylase UbiE
MPLVKDTAYWARRAQEYDQLEWVNEEQYLKTFVAMGDFQPTDIVLDAGTGTGAIARTVAPLVREVIGVDKSQDMLERIKDDGRWQRNLYFIQRDIVEPIFRDGVFDKVTARMVFHHLVGQTETAMRECFRVLKPEGRIVLAEGVPPSAEVKPDYIRIFQEIEPRETFMEGDLQALLETAGFRQVEIKVLVLPQMSVKNWLEHRGLPDDVQKRVFRMHVDAADYFKEAYRMTVTPTDCLIDMKVAILSAVKPAARRKAPAASKARRVVGAAAR